MAHQAERAGVVGIGRSRGITPFKLACLEVLESRVLLTHSAILDVRAVAPVTYHTNVIAPIVTRSVAQGPDGYTPAQVRKAYGIDQTFFGSVTGDGTGSTIAIVDAYKDPTIQTDLNAFDTQFGLPALTITQLNQSGGMTLPRIDPAGPGDSWALETSLDVEWAHAVAPGANIVLVEATSSDGNDLDAAVTTAKSLAGVSVVSMSFGGQESRTDLGSNSIYTTPTGHIGVTFVASSGDSGSFADDSGVTAVEYPAASPNVVGVGGTSLTTQADGTYISESAWGDGRTTNNSGGFFSGSGGGISTIETQPTYQKGIVTQSTTKRTVPDVAFLADPATGVAVYDSTDDPNSPWIVLGGTSLAAPMWAGVIAITNQGRTLAGKATLDGATQMLPALYALPSSDFNDITTGANGAYSAGPGYDLVTGRGTPIVNLVVNDLVGSAAVTVLPTPFIGGFTVTPTSVNAGDVATLAATDVGEAGGTIAAVIFYRESDGTAGLSTATDTLVGVGTFDGVTWSLTTSTAGLASGTYTYYAVATDITGQATTATTVLTVAAGVATNDNFANATPLATTQANVTGTNVGATKEVKEPTIAKTVGGKSVWYTWTAPATGNVALNTNGSSFDTLLGVYTGTVVSKLKLVASSDDASYAVVTSALNFKAKAGVTYHFVVDGYNGAAGTLDLNLNQAPIPTKKKK